MQVGTIGFQNLYLGIDVRHPRSLIVRNYKSEIVQHMLKGGYPLRIESCTDRVREYHDWRAYHGHLYKVVFT